jgi:hypothetical protein
MKFKRRRGEIKQGCVLSQSKPATDTPAPILSACGQLLLPVCVFVIRDTVRNPWRFCLENLFVNRGLRKPRPHCIYVELLAKTEILTSYIHGAPCNARTFTVLYIYISGFKARHFNVVYTIWTYVWQRWKPPRSICCTMFRHWINAQSYPMAQLCPNIFIVTKFTLIIDVI